MSAWWFVFNTCTSLKTNNLLEFYFFSGTKRNLLCMCRVRNRHVKLWLVVYVQQVMYHKNILLVLAIKIYCYKAFHFCLTMMGIIFQSGCWGSSGWSCCWYHGCKINMITIQIKFVITIGRGKYLLIIFWIIVHWCACLYFFPWLNITFHLFWVYFLCCCIISLDLLNFSKPL